MGCSFFAKNSKNFPKKSHFSEKNFKVFSKLLVYNKKKIFKNDTTYYSFLYIYHVNQLNQ